MPQSATKTFAAISPTVHSMGARAAAHPRIPPPPAAWRVPAATPQHAQLPDLTPSCASQAIYASPLAAPLSPRGDRFRWALGVGLSALLFAGVGYLAATRLMHPSGPTLRPDPSPAVRARRVPHVLTLPTVLVTPLAPPSSQVPKANGASVQRPITGVRPVHRLAHGLAREARKHAASRARAGDSAGAPTAGSPGMSASGAVIGSSSAIAVADRVRTAMRGAAVGAAEAELPVPEPALLSSALPEQPSREDVKQGLERVRTQLDACAQGAHGTLFANLTITGAGGVSYSVIEGAFAGTPQGSCMARALRTAHFPAFEASTLHVRYPFVL